MFVRSIFQSPRPILETKRVGAKTWQICRSRRTEAKVVALHHSEKDIIQVNFGKTDIHITALQGGYPCCVCEKNNDHIYLFHNMSRLSEGIHPSFIQRCASIACMRSKMSKSSFERKICSSLFLSNFGDIWVTFKPQTVTLDLRTRNGDGSSRVQIKFGNFPLLGFFSDGDFWMM